MNTFSQLLKKYIDKSGYTHYGLAQKAAVNRSTLQKVLSGDRTPSLEFFKKITPYLKLTPKESAELANALDLLQTGRDVYERRQYVRKLLEEISYLPQSPDFELPSPYHFTLPPSDEAWKDYDPGDTSLHEGTYAVKQLVSRLLLKELTMETPCVRVNIPGHLNLLREVITPVIGYCCSRGLKIRHLTGFLRSGIQKDASLINLNILANILPFLSLNTFQYEVYYYYQDSIDGGFGKQAAFSYYILFSQGAVLLDSSCSNALYLSSPDIMNHVGNLFEASLKPALPFTIAYQDPREMLYHLIETDAEDRPFYTLEFQPCLSSYVTDMMIQNYMRSEGDQARILTELFTQRVRQLRSCNNRICIFSKAGLYHFAQTGELADLPSHYALPLSPHDRITILEALYHDISSNTHMHRMVNPLVFSISKHLICIYHPEAGLDFSYYSEDGSRYNYLRIEELTLLETFDDFFQYLLHSPLVCTREETLTAIQDCLKELRQR